MDWDSMKYELSQRFFFEAAHTLARQIEAEGSRRIHGHTYHAEVTLSGVPDPRTGMMLDLGFLRLEIERVRQQLDHHLLDEVDGIGPATLENLCLFIYQQLRQHLTGISCVMVERQASGDRCRLICEPD
jgi:6-pyruvoyltetrahydropterin/6-carboxytetrahydropterin synthase